MNQIISAYMVINVIMIILNAAMAGGGGLASTTLTSNLNSTSNTMYVTSTASFLSADVLVIDDEYVSYTGKTNTSFTGLVRGYNSSTAASHVTGKMVYTQETGMINQALGFNVASTSSTVGVLPVVSMTANFLGRALLNMVIWDFPNIFNQDETLKIIRIILIACGVGLLVYIGLNYLLPAMGILKK